MVQGLWPNSDDVGLQGRYTTRINVQVHGWHLYYISDQPEKDSGISKEDSL